MFPPSEFSESNNMFGQDFMGTARFQDLRVKSEMMRLCNSNEKMAETPNGYYKYRQGDHMKDMMMLLENFQADPQVVPQLEDCTKRGYAQDQQVVDESFNHQEQENSMKAAEFIVPDEHSEAGGDCCGALKKKYENSRRSIFNSSTDEFIDDYEESSEGFTREVPSVTHKGSKRKRIAEALPYSYDKRRRANINQKMRVLRNLIPNCNKMDEASVLDKAIEYLKNLQFQFQVMSMGIRPYTPPVISTFAMHMPYVSVSPMAVAMAMSLRHRNVPLNPVTVPLVSPFNVNSPLSPLLQQFLSSTTSSFQCPLVWFLNIP